MKCPKCRTVELETTQVRGIEVDRCLECGGIWFDDRELETLLEVSRRELRRLQSGSLDEGWNRKRGKCPRDHSDLLRVCSPRDASLIIDVCVECNGVWLDGGELGRVLAASG